MTNRLAVTGGAARARRRVRQCFTPLVVEPAVADLRLVRMVRAGYTDGAAPDRPSPSPTTRSTARRCWTSWAAVRRRWSATVPVPRSPCSSRSTAPTSSAAWSWAAAAGRPADRPGRPGVAASGVRAGPRGGGRCGGRGDFAAAYDAFMDLVVGPGHREVVAAALGTAASNAPCGRARTSSATRWQPRQLGVDAATRPGCARRPCSSAAAPARRPRTGSSPGWPSSCRTRGSPGSTATTTSCPCAARRRSWSWWRATSTRANGRWSSEHWWRRAAPRQIRPTSRARSTASQRPLTPSLR